MQYIVTGATGFVGKSFVSELLNKGEKVTALIRNRSKIPEEWKGIVRIIETDLQNLNEVRLEKQADSCFVHMAWEGTSGQDRADEKKQWENIKGIQSAIALAADLGCKRFVYTGSIMEYEAMKALTYDGFEPGSGMIYSTAKLAGDFLARIWCQKYHLEYVCVIISNIYGPGEKSERFLNTLIRKMIKDESIDLTQGDQLYDFIYITDAVQGIYQAAQKGENCNSYYLGNVTPQRLKDYILQTKKILGSKSILNFGSIAYGGIPLTWEEFDTTKLQAMGFTPEVSFEQGVLACRQQIQDEGMEIE